MKFCILCTLVLLIMKDFLQSIPLLNEKDNQHNNTISLRGIRNPMFEQLFMMFPIDLDCGITDMVIINEKKHL